jgi:hypothetical protein
MSNGARAAAPCRRVQTLVTGVVLLALISSACSARVDDRSGLSELQSAVQIMELPLADFVEESAADSRDPRLDWTTDLCSGPSVFSIWDDEFADACHRHDFGYRNFGSTRALDKTAERRDLVDQIFARDMATICETREGPLRASCLLDANVFYLAVHETPWGRSAFFG